MQENKTVCPLEARASSAPDRGGVSEAGRGGDAPRPGGAEEVLHQPRVQSLEDCVQTSVPEKVQNVKLFYLVFN